eukprot:scaffold9523_cov103-Cylindrotheca_fusiformis.AAC.21
MNDNNDDDEDNNRKPAAVPSINDDGNGGQRRSNTNLSGRLEGSETNYFVYSNETNRRDIPSEDKLTHLRVDSSVQEIPDELFKFCFVLKAVQLPDTLSRIGRRAFSRCLNLRSVRFFSTKSTPSFSSTTIHLEDRSVVFPNTIKSLVVEDRAFESCDSLQRVTIGSLSTKFGKECFSDCKSLRNVELPEGLQDIGPHLLMTCHLLVTVKIPSSVITISERAFENCSSLAFMSLPHGLQSIGYRSFSKCCSLERLDIPSTVSTIGKEAFESCTCLACLNLCQGLESIGESSFSNCRSLETLDIPSTVSTIGRAAFSDCFNLKHVKLSTNLEILSSYLFTGCKSLGYVNIPSSVIEVQEFAFLGCITLSHMRIPTSVTRIGQNAFYECYRLISLEIPASSSRDIFDNHLCLSTTPLVNLVIPSSEHCEIERFWWERSKFASFVDGGEDLMSSLKNRFDDSPLHKLCYYQSYHPLAETMKKLRNILDANPSAGTSKVDRFGMTSLHVLALAQSPNLSMLLALINGGHPRDSIIRIRDYFGATPMNYLCMNRILESSWVIKSLFQHMLGRTPWIDQWKFDVLGALDKALTMDWSSRVREVGLVSFKFAKFERMEVLSQIELFLWRIKIDDVGSMEGSDRQSFRFSSGVSIVVPNVLGFLDKVKVEDFY